MFDPNRPDLLLGIVGSGVMGRGIAQVAASAGLRVRLHDARPGAVAEAREFVARMLRRQAEKGRLPPEAAEAALARIEETADLGDFAGCHLVVEAIVEELEAKRTLFRDLESVVGEDCVLATNTSSLSVTAIAAACRRPERVAGFHFFNPVPLMRLVEVVGGVRTAPAVLEALEGLARRFGHEPVRVADMPGFLVNHAGRGYPTEALALLGEGVADPATLDAILREGAGFRMGPFELLDLTGLDVSHPVMESIYHQFYEEPRFRPSPLTRRRLEAGLLGRKSGRGFYAYEAGRPVVPAPPAPPAARPASVWIAPGPHAPRLERLVREMGGRIERDVRPSAEALILVTPVGTDCTATARALGLDPARTVAVDPLFGLDSHRTLMTNPATRPEYRDMARGLLAADGVPVGVIRDSAGFVCQRVVATIVNIACEIAQRRIAAPEAIDRAVRLGLGYPKGPLEWGDALGPGVVVEILDAVHARTGDPRYRASLWLRRRAELGLSLRTPEDLRPLGRRKHIR